MSEKNKKRQIAKITVFITSIFVIFMSITYALVTKIVIGSKELVINAGVLDLVLEEENEITISDALPMYDQVGMIQEESFDFRLVNKGETPVNYQLKLVDVSTGNSLSKNIVRYGLTKNGNTTIDYVSTPYMGIIDSGIIQEDEIYNYQLRLWISDKVVDEEKLANKSLSLKIEVKAGQLDETKYIGMLQARKDTEAFWKYKESITSVVFENKISVPEEGIEESWDVSSAKDGSVMAYIEDDGLGTDTYKLHIQGNDVIYANIDSSKLFYIFKNTTSIEGLEYFDTSNVTNMHRMFDGCTNLTELDVSNFDTSNVTDMSYMLINCSNLVTLDISSFDTSNVTNMNDMFSGCVSLMELDVTNFDTSNVNSMRHMFSSCGGLTSLDLSSFDTSNVTDMRGMFSSCGGLTSLDLSSFDTSKVTVMSHMFSSCGGLTSLDLSSFDTSKVTDLSHMFSSCGGLTSLDLSSFDTSKVTVMSYMFSSCGGLTSLDLSSFDTSNVTDMSYMFSSFNIAPDLSNFDTSNVTNMERMFANCGSIKLDLSGIDTSKVTNMAGMFYYSRSIMSIEFGDKFDTSNVTDMSYMFYGCGVWGSLKTLNVSSFDTSNVTNMAGMFGECNGLISLDLSNFNTSKVTNMDNMFYTCGSWSGSDGLTLLDLSSFDTSNVTSMRHMFDNCITIQLIEFGDMFDMSNVTDMAGMFKKCSNLTAEITINGNTTNYNDMFADTATATDALITVSYTADTSALVDEMLKTKSTNSNVVKGKEVE